MKKAFLATVRSFGMLLAGSAALGGCASIEVLTPAENATAQAPVSTDVFWNGDLQPNTFKVVLDPGSGQSDITGQFSAVNTSANSHSTASLNLSQGAHKLLVSADIWNGFYRSFQSQSVTRAFQVNNSAAAGQPVTYTLTVFNFDPGQPAGSLGNITFGGTNPNAPNFNVNLVFTFSGNTADVVAYTAPRPGKPNCTNHAVNDGSGFEIISGTATVTIQDAATKNTIAAATFLPAAGIFVSVDNGNGGIGFGSNGALPSDPKFPDHGIEVAYPYGQFMAPSTDLRSNYTATADWDLSCVGFNGSPGQADPVNGCHIPLELPTTAGVFKIFSNTKEDPAPPGVFSGIFTTVTATNNLGDNASLTLTIAGSIHAGAAGTVSVTVTNTGTSTWQSAYGLSLEALGRAGLPINSVAIPANTSVPANQSVTLSFTVQCNSQGLAGVAVQMAGPAGLFGERVGQNIVCQP